MPAGDRAAIRVRRTEAADFDDVITLCRAVYPATLPWTAPQLQSHMDVFPEGQLVAIEEPGGQIVGMAASLIIAWDDYDVDASWRDVTDKGFFTNHDPAGRTLYGAEVMVHPDRQGRGIGQKLYAARRDLARSLGLVRIRAGARLRGYHRYVGTMTAEAYTLAVLRGELRDPTLSFQLRQDFKVFAVVEGYLRNDPESLGYAALIEWLNPDVATPGDSARRNPRFDT